MKLTALHNENQKGFTLIELIVVIAIIGILAVVLLVVIDPLDKINSANDTGVVSFLTQAGKANDTYAAQNNNSYVAGTSVNTALAVLNTAGESKYTSYNPPIGYTVNYATTTTGCPAGMTSCYAFWVTNLKSNKNKNGTPPAGGPQYMWANGKGCYVASTTTIAATSTCP